ncbi:6368_t:CDS:2 [Entrophospora sp. SA101]|nr:6368_t:CDS:2 [Entrophospora sp. SA101]
MPNIVCIGGDSAKALALAGFDAVGYNEWVYTLLKKYKPSTDPWFGRQSMNITQ